MSVHSYIKVWVRLTNLSFFVSGIMAEIVWEYQCFGSKWLEFDKELSSFLNGVPADSNEADREVVGWNMRFNLREMRLRSMDTGFVRNIRCAVLQTIDAKKFLWTYQFGPRNRWISFPPQLTIKLEKRFGALENASNDQETADEQKIEFTLNGKEVQLDWNAKMLTVLDTEEKHAVKRTESYAGPPDSSNPPHPKSSPTAVRLRTLRIHEETSQKRARKSAGETSKTKQQKSPKAKRGRPKKRPKIEDEESSDEREKQNEKEIDKDEIKQMESDNGGEEEGTSNSKENREESERTEKRETEKRGKECERIEPEVDLECRELMGKVHVYVDEGEGHCYDVMLNQTNIQQNNNKFYLMQVLRSNVGTNHWVWFRWGRVGFKGQTNLTSFGSELDRALAMFHAKFTDKTRNNFLACKNNFVKVSGKYDLIKIDYKRKAVVEKKATIEDNVQTQTNDESESKNEETKQKLDERVRNLMDTICDLKALERDARKFDYDFKRIPLGKITKEQIQAGFEALSRIELHIQDQKFDKDFREAVNAYYTRIPHSFGMRTPPMIETIAQLKQEIELLELLTGIEITVAEIGGDALEQHYARLRWDMVPLEKDEENFKMVEEYLTTTHGQTHDRYHLELRNVFKLLPKNGFEKKFRDDLGNRKLLWHGSRLANWYSILAQGLRIAPPEAPSTGYMFGKGAYFADVSSKSANYSLSDQNRPGFLLLSEVALGEVIDLRESDCKMHLKLPAEKHSVRGVGRYVPNPDSRKIFDVNIEVPCGKTIENKELEIDNAASLIYNEFIVYSLDQIKERFLVEVGYKFDFDL